MTNAHRILHGELPQDDPKAFWNRPVPVAEDIAQRVVNRVCELMPEHFKAHPEGVQVLCPGKKNIAGMNDLNLRLNPPAPDKPPAIPRRVRLSARRPQLESVTGITMACWAAARFAAQAVSSKGVS
ncbi:hypothetical protein [Streptomyces sp. ISL-100]|uniref:hypothetical protein n=1 Tax=Streptomyces sp. ISL-100 TaxID=2819173 RepID=UPI001BEC23CB|nr:hypothetical protein [Streptomyces sp. ISL-100]MBT2399340.1 hypothetical protein [Streptomyces sp. ISL-100]